MQNSSPAHPVSSPQPFVAGPGSGCVVAGPESSEPEQPSAARPKLITQNQSPKRKCMTQSMKAAAAELKRFVGESRARNTTSMFRSNVLCRPYTADSERLRLVRALSARSRRSAAGECSTHCRARITRSLIVRQRSGQFPSSKGKRARTLFFTSAGTWRHPAQRQKRARNHAHPPAKLPSGPELGAWGTLPERCRKLLRGPRSRRPVSGLTTPNAARACDALIANRVPPVPDIERRPPEEGAE
jgi:hypothetical protein